MKIKLFLFKINYFFINMFKINFCLIDNFSLKNPISNLFFFNLKYTIILNYINIFRYIKFFEFKKIIKNFNTINYLEKNFIQLIYFYKNIFIKIFNTTNTSLNYKLNKNIKLNKLSYFKLF
jgi:hypothetical protein